MGQLFNSNTQVVHYEPSAGKYVKTNKWLLWPVIAYRVMIPYPTPKDLNLFQETILRLFELGINDKNVMTFDTKSEYLAWSEPIAWAIEHGYLESEPTW